MTEFESRFLNKVICGDWVEVLKEIPDRVAHCCITSPPYWGQRNYGVEGQLGLEKTPEEHIENLVVGFREVRRVLRDDAPMWLNYGDKYAGGKCGGGSVFENGRTDGRRFYEADKARGREATKQKHLPLNLKPGDLLGLPWRVALALQADGWYLHSDTIWAKAVSLWPDECPHCGKPLFQALPNETGIFGQEIAGGVINKKKSGSTMPESVNGWRWEQHRVTKCLQCGALASFKKKVCKECNWQQKDRIQKYGEAGLGFRDHSGLEIKNPIEWADCPGCPKCLPNDGLVLRKGSWRPTRAHEYLFLLTKTDKYFCDAEAVREAHAEPWRSGKHESNNPHSGRLDDANKQQAAYVVAERNYNPSGRNLRDVWCINPQAYPGAHYATFPEKLVEPCIKASCSDKGCCPKCGSQWARIVKQQQIKRLRLTEITKPCADRRPSGNAVAGINTTTLGWRPTCKCGIEETVPCLILDPFMGSGTVGAVAASLGHNFVGIELNPKYIKKQAEPRIAQGARPLLR